MSTTRDEWPIRVERLTRTYGPRRGVTEISFDVAAGEVFGFLGPNGAGKTTTMRVLMGLLRPTSGSARIFGLDCWREGVRARERVGFLPGDIRVYDEMTGAEFLDFFAGLRGRADRHRRRTLCERLDVELGATLGRLSKGNRQKVAMVQALEHDPPLVVLDEPTSGLDPLSQRAVIELLREEKARGRTIFLSSHILTEVDRLADRVAIIRDGALVAVEAVARLKAVRERRMDVVLRERTDPGLFAAVDGVRVLASDDAGTHHELAVRGDPGPLLAVLGRVPVADFTFAPADLESVFLHYYGDAAPAHAGSAAR